MDPLTIIDGRRTAPVLNAPEPTHEQLTRILRAATTAPDHKLLRPWRFVVVRGDERQRLGQALVKGAVAQNPAISPDILAKQAQKPTRAPLLVAVIASPRLEAKAPVWEQHASAAAAAQNICLAANALGLGSAWKSTGFGEQAPVREFFGMAPHESLFGWIELGHLPEGFHFRERPPLRLEDVVTEIRDGAARPWQP